MLPCCPPHFKHPTGLNLKKNNLAWNVQSRLHMLIPLENFYLDLENGDSLVIFVLVWKFQNYPLNKGPWRVARLKFSFSLEKSNPSGRSWIFQSLGPWGTSPPTSLLAAVPIGHLLILLQVNANHLRSLDDEEAWQTNSCCRCLCLLHGSWAPSGLGGPQKLKCPRTKEHKVVLSAGVCHSFNETPTNLLVNLGCVPSTMHSSYAICDRRTFSCEIYLPTPAARYPWERALR